MKSIVEEASTVLKAIEKGWLQAGKPCEFTVKIYEEGVKNFFGMSVEPAKICIFFEDKPSKPTAAPRQHQRKEHTFQSEQRNKPLAPVAHQHPQAVKQQSSELPAHKERRERPAQAQSTKIMWTDELVNASKEWLSTTLAVMGKGDCAFTIEAKKYHLIVTFARPVLEDKERERALFRSFAHVLMQSLRNHFKKGLRGYRVVLNTSQVS